MVKSKKAPPPEFEQSVAAKPVARRREREEDAKDADAERAHRRRRTTPGGPIGAHVHNNHPKGTAHCSIFCDDLSTDRAKQATIASLLTSLGAETRPSLSDEEKTVSPRQGGVVEDEGLDEQIGRKAEKYLEAVVKVEKSAIQQHSASTLAKHLTKLFPYHLRYIFSYRCFASIPSPIFHCLGSASAKSAARPAALSSLGNAF